MLDNLKAKLAGAKRSATIWFNSAAGVVVFGLPILQDNLPQLQDYLPHNFYHYAMGGVIFANLLLRFKTKTSLENR